MGITDKQVKNETELEVMRTAGAEVVNIVSGERNICYGTPSENHDVTGVMWGAYLSRKFGVKLDITGSDVCWLNNLQKASRQAHWPKRDNAIDAAGYALNSLACEHAAGLKNCNAALPLQAPQSADAPVNRPVINRLPGTDQRECPPMTDNRQKTITPEQFHADYVQRSRSFSG